MDPLQNNRTRYNQTMKKLLTFFLLLPVTLVYAAPGNFTVSWDSYPVKEATIHAMCKLPSEASFAEVGSTLATSNSVNFTKDVPMGQTLNCSVVATLGSSSSAVSNSASYTEPVVLPQPTGCSLTRN